MNGSTHPPNRRPPDHRPRPNLGGRPCKRVIVLDPLLVPLDPENERAALIALAVLLAPVGAADSGDGTEGTATPTSHLHHQADASRTDNTGRTASAGRAGSTDGTATPTSDNHHDQAVTGQEGEAPS